MAQTGTIGIIGGGQLGRMLTLAALPLGYRVIVVDPVDNSPAKQVGAEQIVGGLHDETALRQLADQVDYLTIEIEHLDAKLLEEIAGLGKPVNPAPKTIGLIQDKLEQKKFLRSKNIPVADFMEITDGKSAIEAAKEFGGTIFIKTRQGGFDGRGNKLVSSPDDLKEAFEIFNDQPIYAERFMPFKKELAVMVAKGADGNIASYPVVETVQERSICTEVLAPADISAALAEEARAIAIDVVNQLDGAGIYGIELFLTNDDKILVNEIAPRVHNSGHYTLDANRTSQFEQHIRAITGLPLGSTELLAPAAVMVNILGERDGDTEVTGLKEALAMPGVSVHLYGKSPTKVDRKMGHITALGMNLNEAREHARAARKALSI